MKERIQLLTDVGKNEVKNFYGNIFLIELDNKVADFHYYSLQDKENDSVNLNYAIGLPITLPSGGNPIHAQGIYPIPCYPMYNRHLKEFRDIHKTTKMIYDRLIRTVPYLNVEKNILSQKAEILAKCLKHKTSEFIIEERQLGILMIVDYSLDLFSTEKNSSNIFIKDCKRTNKKIFINPDQIISNIIESRFQEAKELGTETNSVSTISNEISDQLVSAYNKSWLWLSPTWKSPKSIYWSNKDWTKGIRLNRKDYKAYFYGSQFLKQIQTPIHASVLKEMFAPTNSVEAKKHMNPTSFETIYGIPYFLPLTNSDPIEVFTKYQNLKTRTEAKEIKESDLQLEIISGLQKKIIRDATDDYRITIIYYSGNLSRGDIHIRGQIEDIVPSAAQKVQSILKKLNGRFLKKIAHLLNIPEKQYAYTSIKVRYLPTLLSNAYGPGYIWTSMNKVLHQRTIGISRVIKKSYRRISELANKNDLWGIRHELLFYHLFVVFYQQYNAIILNREESIMNIQEWEEILNRYTTSELTHEDVDTVPKVGFISGCLVQQFERSYWMKAGKNYLDTRVMRFGSKLTPEMIWKNGLLRMGELHKQWDLKLRNNFMYALSLILPSFIDLNNSHLLTKEKDEFMTMFWSGYLMFSQTKKEDELNVSE